MSGQHLDLSSDPPVRLRDEPVERPFLGVHFACCGVYARIYRNAEATAYAGHCPRCTRGLRVQIGAGGRQQRFFTAY